MISHFVQSASWCKLKNAYGTTCVSSSGVFYTKHKIPLTHYYVAYCPRVNPFDIDFAGLHKSLLQNNCVYINFDVPNIVLTSETAAAAREIFENQKCVISQKETFANANILIDLTKSDEELLSEMHHKRRYNIKQAQKQNVYIKEGTFDEFWNLLNETATTQKFFLHPKKYYKMIWDTLGPAGENKAHILTAYVNESPLASWMLFIHGNVLYYPYGGSNAESGKYHASELLGWEAIKFGKQNACTLFDMWGASKDPTDEKDSYFGFTQFKSRFGGTHVTYMKSYDYVLNWPIYNFFNLMNKVRWLILRAMR